MSQRPRAPYRFRFGLGTLLLVMIVVAVASAGISYMVQAQGSNGWQRLVFMLFTLAAPVLLLILVSAFYAIGRWSRRR